MFVPGRATRVLLRHSEADAPQLGQWTPWYTPRGLCGITIPRYRWFATRGDNIRANAGGRNEVEEICAHRGCYLLGHITFSQRPEKSPPIIME